MTMQSNISVKGKKLLILAGASVHCKLVKAARELGVFTIVTDNLDCQHSPAKSLADEYWNIDIYDTERIINMCRESKVDGVLNYCIDPAQLPYQVICSELGFPCYGSKEQFDIMTNKKKFRAYCKSNGLDVVPEYTLNEIKCNDDVFPVLVKPSESRGSRGQSVCENIYELIQGIEVAKKESIDGKYIIEKYMLGKRDLSLAYIIINSKPFLLKIGDRYLGLKQDNLERQQICTIMPSASLLGYEEVVEPAVKNFISSLGIEFGPFFLQGFIDDNKLLFYDPGLRFPGSDFDMVIEHATGFSAAKTLILFSLTGDKSSCFGNPVNAYSISGGICFIISIAVRPGRIKTIEISSEIANDQRVLSIEQRAYSGDVVPSSGDIRQRAIEICALIPQIEELKDFVEFIYDNITIIDDNNESMLVSRVYRDINIEYKSLIH